MSERPADAERESRLADLFLALLTGLAASVEPRATVSAVLSRTRDALGADDVSLFLLEAGGHWLRGSPGEWDWTRTSFAVPLTEWPNVRRILAGTGSERISAAEAAGAELGWFEPRGVATTQCVPVRTDGLALGVLFFDYAAAGTEVGAEEVRFVEAVAEQCGVALRRAFRSEAEDRARLRVERTLRARESLLENLAARLTRVLSRVAPEAATSALPPRGATRGVARAPSIDLPYEIALLESVRRREWDRATELVRLEEGPLGGPLDSMVPLPVGGPAGARHRILGETSTDDGKGDTR